MQKPQSNLPAGAQKYRRWLESELERKTRIITSMDYELQRLAESNGTQLTQLSNLKTGDISDLYDRIEALYTSTGNTYPPAPPPPKPVPVVPKYDTKIITADWSECWSSGYLQTGSGTYTDAEMLYQGSNPENKVGAFGVDLGSIRGHKITDMQVYLKNVSFPWATSGSAAFGTHGYANPPAGRPNRHNGFNVSWHEGEGKYVGVPSKYWAGFSNGSYRGLTIGDIGPNDPNSAIFEGVGKAHPPKLKITYQL